MITLKEIKTCKHCGDFLIWIDDRWLCPTCDKKLIEKLKYRIVIEDEKMKLTGGLKHDTTRTNRTKRD